MPSRDGRRQSQRHEQREESIELVLMLSRLAVYGEPSRTTMVEDKVNDMSAAIPLWIARVGACPELKPARFKEIIRIFAPRI